MSRNTRIAAAAPTRSSEAIRLVVNSLRRVVRDLRLSARGAERVAGISGAQLFVLQALSEANASSLNNLANRTLTDQSSVSVVVKRLVDRKLVARKTSSVDARRVELALTASGRRLLARCPEPTQTRIVAAIRRLQPVEMGGLTRGLDALVREMGLGEETPRMFFDEEAATAKARRPRP